MTNTSLEVIGYVRCDYKEKFGIPRQSGLTGRATAFIEILPPYNQAEAFRGLDGFSHIWLLWDFSRAHKNGFTATVKPPKLGGNQRMGVFATRSPFRPNNIGLSSVKLLDIIYNEETAVYTDLWCQEPIYWTEHRCTISSLIYHTPTAIRMRPGAGQTPLIFRSCLCVSLTISPSNLKQYFKYTDRGPERDTCAGSKAWLSG